MTDARSFYGEMLRVEGLQEEKVYRVFMGEAELGSYSGEELAQGIDLSAAENHPLGTYVRQMEELNRQRHEIAARYRSIWIDIVLRQIEYTPEQIQAEYENWRTADEKLREESLCLAREAAGNTFRMYVIEEGYTAEELEQEAQAVSR